MDNTIAGDRWSGIRHQGLDIYIARNHTGAITLTWPAPSTGWMLQRSISMTPESWQLVIIPPQTIGEWKSLVLPISEDKEFFRLKRP